jgi:hypothetical protein
MNCIVRIFLGSVCYFILSILLSLMLLWPALSGIMKVCKDRVHISLCTGQWLVLSFVPVNHVTFFSYELLLLPFSQPLTYIKIRIVGGGVQMGPLGTSATEWPIVPAPGDYDDGEFGGMKIGRGNRSTRRKPAPAPLCPPQIPLDQTQV